MGTQITDSIALAEQALQVMDDRAVLVRQVAMQILGKHAAGLPELSAVRVEASYNRAHVALQPHTVQDARQWAKALGVELTVQVKDETPDGWRGVHTFAELVVDDVEVRLGAYQSYSPVAWAEREAAEQVAA